MTTTTRTLEFEPLEDRLLFSATPFVEIHVDGGTDHADEMISESFNFTVRFENSSDTASDVGFGPFIGLKVGKGIELEDGARPYYLVESNKLDVVDEYTYDADEAVGGVYTFELHGQEISLREGERFYVYNLPFGSFVPGQEGVDLTFAATTKKDLLNPPSGAQVGQPIDLEVYGGFLYGDTPTGANGPIFEAGNKVHGSVTPVVWDVTKHLLSPEHETATGPNYEQQWQIIVDIANGETLTNIDILDTLPDNLQYKSITVTINGQAYDINDSGSPFTVTTPDTETPGGVLSIHFADAITGTTAADDIVISYTTFVPQYDADGQEIIRHQDGLENHSTNAVQATADHETGALADYADGNTQTLDDQSLAIQKSASNHTDPNRGGILPDDHLDYHLDYQVSDYFTFDDVFIIDTLSDGQRFLDGSHADGVNPSLHWQERGTAGSGTLYFDSDGGANSIIDHLTDGSLPEGFRVSVYDHYVVLENFSNAPAGSDGLVTYNLGNTPVGGRVTDPALLNGIEVRNGETKIIFFLSNLLADQADDGILVGGRVGSSAGATTGQIDYRVQVQDRYHNPLVYTGGSGSDPSIDLGDTIGNHVVINGRVLQNHDPSQDYGGNRVTDDSSTGHTVPGPVLQKSIYAIDGTLFQPGDKAAIGTGETLTYKLNLRMPTADVEELKIKDYVPLPKFDVDEFDYAHVYVIGSSQVDTLLPDHLLAGHVVIVLDDTVIAGESVYSLVTANGTRPVQDIFTFDSVSNSFEVNLGTFDIEGAHAADVDVYFTLAAKESAMADGLLLTNQMVATYKNTGTESVVDASIVQVTIEEPVLTIRKGVVGYHGFGLRIDADGDLETSDDRVLFTPDGGFTFTDGNGVNTTAEAESIGNGLAASGLEAGSTVRYGIVVENTGRADAYDIVISDTLPDHLGNATDFVVQYGDGTLVDPADYTVTPGVGNNFTITFNDPAGQGFLGKGIDSADPETPLVYGRNFLVITYSATVLDQAGSSSSLENEVNLTNFTGRDNGTVNRVPTNDPARNTDTAIVFTATPTLTKELTSTSVIETGNTLDQVVIGEIVTYTLELTIPEGTTYHASLEDTLDAGMAFLPGSVTVTYGTGITSTQEIISADGVTLTIDFGDILNDANAVGAETITITYQAVVLNVTGNNAGHTLGNHVAFNHDSLDLSIDPDEGEIAEFSTAATLTANADNVTIVEPTLTVTIGAAKTDAPGTTFGDLNATTGTSALDAGDTIYYQIVITNAGNLAAYDIALTSVLPDPSLVSGLTIESVTGAGGVTSVGSLASLFEIDAVTSTLRTVTGADIDMGDGSSITILVKGTLTTLVTPQQSLLGVGGQTTGAKVTWTSLDGDFSNPQIVGNTNSVERNGSESPGRNDYVDRDTVVVTLRAPENSKTVIATSESDTTGNNVTVGEIVRYELKVKVPEGTSPNLRIIDNLPPGIVFINDDQVEVHFESGQLSSSSGHLNDPGNDIHAGFIRMDGSLVHNDSGADVYGSGTDVVFELGTVTNSDTNDGTAEYIVIRFNALVLNTSQVIDGATLTNQASTRVGSGADDRVVGNVASVNVHVVEPKLTVSKTVNSTTAVQAGNTLTYTIKVRNTGTAVAYDVRIADIVDQIYAQNSTVDIQITGINIVNTSGATRFIDPALADGYDDTHLDLLFNRLAVNGEIEVQVTTVVRNVAPAGAQIENWVDVTYSSLPDDAGTSGANSADYGTTPNAAITSTIAGAIANSGGGITSVHASERDADDATNALNTYEVRGTAANVLVSTPTLDKRWKGGSLDATDTSVASSSDNNLVIGETYTYEIVITLPAGVTRSLIVEDFLPPGVSLVGWTVASQGDNITLKDYTGADAPSYSLSGNTHAFNFGNVQVDPLQPGDTTADRQIVLQITGRLNNVIDNQVGVNLSASPAQLKFTDPDHSNNNANGQGAAYAGQVRTVVETNTGNNPALIVAEPRIGVNKVVVPVAGAGSVIDAGDALNYTITLTNTSGQTGYDLVFTDTISQWLVVDGVHNLEVTYTDHSGISHDVTSAFTFSETSGVWSLTSNGLIDLAHNESVTIEFTAVVAANATTGVTINNTAVVEWSSLDNGNPAHNAVGNERNGSGVPHANASASESYNPTSKVALNDYVVRSTITASVVNSIVTDKGLLSSSEGSTDDPNLTIGEVGTYWVKVTVPEGVAPALVLRDYLPAGMTYIAGSLQIVTTAADASALGLTLSEDFGGTIQNAGAVTGVVHSDRIEFAFEQITVTDDNNGNNNVFYLVYEARVLDVPGNTGTGANPTDLTNTVRHNNGSGTTFTPPQGETTITVVEPDLQIVKTVSVSGSAAGSTGSGDAGDTVVYTLTISHTALSNATAFDLNIIDQLPEGIVDWVITSAIVSDGASSHSVVASLGWVVTDGVARLVTLDNGSGDAINLTYDDGGQSEQLVITITGKLSNTLEAGSKPLDNVASVTYTTLPSDGATNGDPDHSDFEKQGGERLVSRTSNSVRITTVATIDLVKGVADTSFAHTTGTNVTIGEVVTYQLQVKLQQGVSNDVTLVDDLPTGLDLQSGSVILRTADGVTVEINGNTYANGDAIAAGDYTYASGILTLAFDKVTVPAGEGVGTGIFTIEYQAIVGNVAGNQANHTAEPAVATRTNTATVSVDLTPDDSDATRTSVVKDATVTIIEPRLTLAKDRTTTNATADAGDNVTYQLVITNTGNSTAYNIHVTDLLDGNLELLNFQLSGAGSIYATLDNLAPSSTSEVDAIISELRVGHSITLTINAKVIDTANPGAVIENGASLTYTGIPTGTPGADEGRDGSGGVNDYHATDDAASFTLARPTITKVLDQTSDGKTVGSDLAIGEIVTYRIVVTFTEGVTRSVVITDLGQDNGNAILEILSAEIGTLGGQLSNASGTLAVGLAGVVSSSGGSTFNDTVVFNLGDVTNEPNGSAGAGDRMEILVTARVANHQINQDGDIISNTARLEYVDANDADTTVNTGAVTVTVVEPRVNVSLTVDSATTGVDAGDTVTYRVVLNNTGTGPAYDVDILSQLPPGMVIDADSINIISSTGATIQSGLNGSGNILTGTYDLNVNGRVEFTFTAKVPVTVTPGAELDADIKVTFSSQDGTVSGERTGADIDFDDPGTPLDNTAPDHNGLTDPLNNYAVGDFVSITADDTFELTKEADKATATIGEIVTYTLRVKLNEGTTENVVITDVLPYTTGPDGRLQLAYITGSAAISYGTGGTSISGSVTPTVGTTGGVANNLLTFDLGTIALPANGTDSNDYVEITYQVRVIDAAVTGGGTLLTNTATGSAKDIDLPVTVTDTVTVVEPELNITKGTTDEDNIISRGETITYIVDLRNPDIATGSTAYNVVISDGFVLTSGDPDIAVTNITVTIYDLAMGVAHGSTLTAGTDYTLTTNGLNNWSIALTDGLLEGYGVQVSYDATFSQDLSAGTTIDNNTRVSYTSLPDAGGSDVRSYEPDGPNEAHDQNTDPLQDTERVTVGTGSIGDRVWLDIDADGIQDGVIAGEVGIVGASVTLQVTNRNGSTYELTTTTGSDGAYRFEGLAPGSNYTVTVTPPTGGTVTDQVDDGTLTPADAVVENVVIGSSTTPTGDANNTIDFGLLGTGSIGDTLYFDYNGNGIQDSPAEVGLAGISVTLTWSGIDGILGNADDLVFTTTTDANGSYAFTGLFAGLYEIVIDASDLEENYGITSAPTDGTGQTGSNVSIPSNAHQFTLAAGESNQAKDFGYQGTGSIEGTSYHDQTRNGTQDGSDTGIGGVTISLYHDTDGDGVYSVGDLLVASTITAADGSYDFGNLITGSYIVVETQPTGFGNGSEGGSNEHRIVINGVSDNETEVNFGNTTSAIEGYVYEDHDNDGARETGETGIANIAVELQWSADGITYTRIADTTTDANGRYRFDYTNVTDTIVGRGDTTDGLLSTGFYRVVEVAQPTEYLDGRDTVGSAGGTIQPDAITAITLPAGVDAIEYNFGELNPVEVSGYVYLDLNENGTKDTFEQGLIGITITLAGTDDLGQTVSRTAITTADGKYVFGDLRPGSYTITQTHPTAYVDGAESVGSFNADGSPNTGAISANEQFAITIANTHPDHAKGENFNFGELFDAEPVKRIIDGTTDGGIATIGDVIRYELEFKIPYGTLNDVTVWDNFLQNLGLEYVGNLVVNLGGATSNVDVSDATNVVSTLGSTNDIWFKLGDLTNNSAGSAPLTITIAFDAIVVDEVGNDRGDLLGNDFSIFWDRNGDSTVGTNPNDPDSPDYVDKSNTVNFTVVEPSLVITKGTTDDDNIISRGETITYIVDLQNPDIANGATAYNVVITDNFVLASGDPDVAITNITVTYYDLATGVASGSTLTAGTDYVLTTNGTNGWSISLTEGLDEGYGVQVTYKATFSQELEAGTIIDNNTRVSYTSLPDADGDEVRSYEPDSPNEIHDQNTDPHQDTERVVIGSGSIGDRVWRDGDSDGVQVVGEVGIVGVTVTLEVTNKDGSTYELTTTTGANGAYRFDGIAPGSNYTVSVTVPAGGVVTDQVDDETLTPNDAIVENVTVVSGTPNNTIDFGLLGTGSIGDTLYFDYNGNGIQDSPAEVGLAGISVTLTWSGIDGILGNADDLVFTTTTDANGSYAFTGLFAGLYEIVIDASDLEENYGITSAPTDGTGQTGSNVSIPSNVHQFTLAAGESNQAKDFGYQGTGSIEGTSYHDQTRNGTQDGSDTGIGGVTISLYHDTNGDGVYSAGDLLVASTITAADGSYDFGNLITGSYIVVETQPTGFGNGSEGGSNEHRIVINGVSDNETEVNFGNTTSAIEGYVYEDHDNDGAREAGETGIANIAVELQWSADGITYTKIADTTTDANGRYRFDYTNVTDTIVGRGDTTDGLLSTGFYRVVEVAQPTGYLDGKDTVGSAGGTIQPDAITAITLPAGVDAIEYNFGELNPVELSGYVYLDLDGDGVKDPFEQGLEGITITLAGMDDLDQDVLIEVTTDANGKYIFIDLRPGTYTITQTQPAAPYIDGAESEGSFHAGGSPNTGVIGGNDQFAISIGYTHPDHAKGENFNFAEGFDAEPVKRILSGVTDGDATIGDIIRYELEFKIPYGTLKDVTVWDNFLQNLGLQYAGNATVNLGGSGTVDVSAPGFQSSIPGSNDVWFKLGNLTNSNADSAPITITIAFDALVIDDAVNQAGETRENDFSVFWDRNGDNTVGANPGDPLSPDHVGTSNEVGFRIVEPSFSITKGVNDDTPDIGQTLDYTLTITNSGANSTTAYDLIVRDELPDGLSLNPGSIEIRVNGVLLDASQYLNVSPTATDLLLFRIAELGVDDVLTITYKATVSQEHSFLGEDLDNNVRLFWDSQPADDANTVYTEGDLGSLPTDGTDRDYGTTLGREPHDVVPGSLGDDPTQDTQRVTVNNNVITGTVYRDVNNNGVYDSAVDTGISGVTITLTGKDINGTTVLLTAITDGSGSYSFLFVPPSDADGYVLTETQPGVYVDAWETPGAAFPGAPTAIVDNTPGADTISTLIIPAQSNHSRGGYNFGEVIGSTVRGSVYEDYNNNGVREAGEAGIEGVTITLTGTDIYGETVLRTVTTDSDGNYRFDDLRPSDASGYTITEGAIITGQLDGKENTGTGSGVSTVNDIISGIAVGQDQDLQNHEFGELPPASISGYVYNDRNGNGERDAGDLGIDNVHVWLVGINDRNETVEVMATTDTEGYYEFTNLRPGEYKLVQKQPSGYTDSADQVGSGFAGAGADGLLHGSTQSNANGTTLPYDSAAREDVIDGIIIANVGHANRVGTNFNFGEIYGQEITKTIVSTSETFTDDSTAGTPADPRDVAIGEVVRYRIVVEIPEGTLDQVVIADLLPSGLIYLNDGNTLVGFVNASGPGSITSSTLPALGVNDPLTVLDGSLISSDLENTERAFTAGGAVYFHLGTVGNLQNDDDREYFVIEFNARVADIGTNVSGTTLANDVAFFHDTDGDPNTPTAPERVTDPIPDQPVLKVVEPKLTVTKVNDDANGVVYAGQFIDYTITVSNLASDGSTSDAFNVALRDLLPAGLRYVDGSVIADASGAQPTSLSFEGGAIIAHFDTLKLGETATITFRVQVSASAIGGSDIDNNVRVHYESVPGTPGEGNPADPTDPNLVPDGPDRDYGPGIGTEDPEPNPGEDDPHQDTSRLTIGSAVISDYVWYDMNGDGLQTGERGISGVTVELYIDEGGTLVLIGTQVTDANGLYAFHNLADGEFVVRVVTDTLPDGAQTVATYDQDGIATPHETAVTLTEINEIRTDIDFGYQGTGAIGDRVFIDRNRNGVYDGGDTGLGGVTVTLTYLGKNGQNIVLTTTTDSSGFYRFDGLLGGNYLISLDASKLPGNVRPTADLDGIDSPHTSFITLGIGQIRMDGDFAYQLPNEVIPGYPDEMVSVYYQMIHRPTFEGWGTHPFDEWSAPKWELIDHTPIFSSPLLSGHAEPGSSIVLALYNHRGELISTSTILVGSGGNWVANFPGVEINGPVTVESTITANNFSALRTDNNFNFRTNYITGVAGGYFQSRYGSIDQAFSELSYERVQAMESALLSNSRFDWLQGEYEFLAESALPSQ